MAETWLRGNIRALALGMIVPGIACLVGMALMAGSANLASRWLGAALALAGGGMLLSLALTMRRPRLAYGEGCLWLYLRHGQPIRVPLEVVEGFLLGQGPAMLQGEDPTRWEAATLVIRLSEKATEWEHLEVTPSLGSWCHHYVTIRGTWCEKLDVELVRRLNARLAEASPQAASRGAR